MFLYNLLHYQIQNRAVPGKTASRGGWNGNQLKFGGWGFREYKCVVWGYFTTYNCVWLGLIINCNCVAGGTVNYNHTDLKHPPVTCGKYEN